MSKNLEEIIQYIYIYIHIYIHIYIVYGPNILTYPNTEKFENEWKQFNPENWNTSPKMWELFYHIWRSVSNNSHNQKKKYFHLFLHTHYGPIDGKNCTE